MASIQALPTNVNGLDSRMTLYRNAFQLAKGNWLLGGGLGSFAGLYSSYILILPVLIFYYSHNLYLDVLIEQGIVGLAAWLVILAGSILIGVRFLTAKKSHDEDRLLAAGLLASLLVLAVHGLIDNPLYAAWGRPFLFVLPGMAYAFTGKNEFVLNSAPIKIPANKVFAVVSVVILVCIGIYHRPLRSAWNANIGSILMAKIQLADWPSGKWTERSTAALIVPAEKYFNRALDLQTTNLTANYRLGLVAYYRQDFLSAEQYLSKAYQLDEQHRGIQKTLGYTYVWQGEFDKASALLEAIPEAGDELDVYTWYWSIRNRNDLVENAKTEISLINQGNDTQSGQN